MPITKENVREMQAKGAITRRSKLSFKEQEFVKEFVKTKNGTKSALKAYNTVSTDVAGAIASENLTKPKIREEIRRLLSDNDVELEEIFSVHKRNLLQDKHLPTSQKAVGDFYEILGLKNQGEASTSTKIAFFIVDKEE